MVVIFERVAASGLAGPAEYFECHGQKSRTRSGLTCGLAITEHTNYQELNVQAMR